MNAPVNLMLGFVGVRGTPNRHGYLTVRWTSGADTAMVPEVAWTGNADSRYATPAFVDAVRALVVKCGPVWDGMVGHAELGDLHTQEAWSDDTYYVARTNHSWFAAILREAIAAVFPVTGGGVAGSEGYRGTGLLHSPNPYEVIYQQGSFGIGD